MESLLDLLADKQDALAKKLNPLLRCEAKLCADPATAKVEVELVDHAARLRNFANSVDRRVNHINELLHLLEL